MRYNKEQLLKIVKPYFDKVDEIYATEDNQVFYVEAKSFAEAHCRQQKLKAPFLLKKEDLKGVKVTNIVEPAKENKEDKDEKQVLIDMAKDLGIKADKRMSIAKIEELIKDKQDAGE